MHRTPTVAALASCGVVALIGAPSAMASDIDALLALESGARTGGIAQADTQSQVGEWCAFTFDPRVIDAGTLDGDRLQGTPSASGSAATAAAPAAAPAAPRFGAAGSWRWQILGGGGTGTDSISNAQLGAGVSWFVVDDLSIDVQVNADYFNQSGPSAWGGDVELLFRWHFLARDTWSLYVDGGCGLMWTSHDVPPDSASFNFLPQAGAGATWEIADDTRLMLGARWFHASNANTGSPNPSYNGVFLYAGVSFGF